MHVSTRESKLSILMMILCGETIVKRLYYDVRWMVGP